MEAKKHMKMSGKSKRVRYSAEEAENMILNDQDRGDSDTDWGKAFLMMAGVHAVIWMLNMNRKPLAKKKS